MPPTTSFGFNLTFKFSVLRCLSFEASCAVRYELMVLHGQRLPFVFPFVFVSVINRRCNGLFFFEKIVGSRLAMQPVLHVDENKDAVGHSVAKWMKNVYDQAINESNTFTIALSGGSMPKVSVAF